MKRTIELEGVNFRDTLFLDSGLLDTKDIMDKDKNIIPLDNERELYDLHMGFYCIAYSKEEIRDEDRILFEKISPKLNKTESLSEILFCGEFEYKGKYCIILSIEQKKEGETNDFLYKGIIINPKLYLESNNITDLKEEILSTLSEETISPSK